METASSSTSFEIPTVFAYTLAGKKKEFQNLLMIELVPSFKLRTSHLYIFHILSHCDFAGIVWKIKDLEFSDLRIFVSFLRKCHLYSLYRNPWLQYVPVDTCKILCACRCIVQNVIWRNGSLAIVTPLKLVEQEWSTVRSFSQSDLE